MVEILVQRVATLLLNPSRLGRIAVAMSAVQTRFFHWMPSFFKFEWHTKRTLQTPKRRDLCTGRLFAREAPKMSGWAWRSSSCAQIQGLSVQFSMANLGTRPNSRVLFVTSVKPRLRA